MDTKTKTIMEKSAAYITALELELEKLRTENGSLKEAQAWKQERRIEELLKTAGLSYGPTLLRDLCAMSFDEAQTVVQTLSKGKTASAGHSLGSAADVPTGHDNNVYEQMTRALQALAQ